jgi:Family of unknown function (DUF6804)
MTKIMKWLSITMLLLAVLLLAVLLLAVLLLAVLQLPVASHPVLLAIVVSASSLLVVAQALRAGKYSWAVGFLAIAVLFNPVVPIARSGRDILWINGVGLAAFLAAAVAFKARPALTVLSITNRLPRRESL